MYICAPDPLSRAKVWGMFKQAVRGTDILATEYDYTRVQWHICGLSYHSKSSFKLGWPDINCASISQYIISSLVTKGN